MSPVRKRKRKENGSPRGGDDSNSNNTPIYLPVIPITRNGDINLKNYSRSCNQTKQCSQFQILKAVFQTTPSPDKNMIYNLCLQTGLTYNECLLWFKYQRKAHKQQITFFQPSNSNIISPPSFVEGFAPVFFPLYPPMFPTSSVTFHPVTCASILKNNSESDSNVKAAKTSFQPPPRLVKKCKKWSAQYSMLSDINEKEYMIQTLVHTLDTSKKKKEFKDIILKQELGLQEKKEFHVRKSSADNLNREVIVSRSHHLWKYLKHRCGSLVKYDQEDSIIDQDGQVQVDAAIVKGLEHFFTRHKDYFMALVHRFPIQEILQYRNNQEKAKTELEEAHV